MQATPRTNVQRSQTTRAALVASARALFVKQGYAETSTPQVAANAGLSRGALYHQFEDKQALFRAVLEAEAAAVAKAIETVPNRGDPRARLVHGARAYMKAMRVPGRTRLLLIEGPAALGPDEVRALDEAAAARTLAAGLMAAKPDLEPAKLVIMTDLLSAAFDRAALSVEAGGDEAAYIALIEALLSATLDAR